MKIEKDQIEEFSDFDINMNTLKTQIKERIEKLVIQKDYKQESISLNSDALEIFELEIQKYFISLFGKVFVKEHFELPNDLKIFLDLGITFYQENWRYIYNIDGILDFTKQDSYGTIEELQERIQEGTMLPNDTLWIGLGWWSDKHEYYICCDKQHPYYGKVFDYNDASPYGYHYEHYCDTFIEFLEALSSKPSLDKSIWKYDEIG